MIWHPAGGLFPQKTSFPLHGPPAARRALFTAGICITHGKNAYRCAQPPGTAPPSAAVHAGSSRLRSPRRHFQRHEAPLPTACEPNHPPSHSRKARMPATPQTPVQSAQAAPAKADALRAPACQSATGRFSVFQPPVPASYLKRAGPREYSARLFYRKRATRSPPAA